MGQEELSHKLKRVAEKLPKKAGKVKHLLFEFSNQCQLLEAKIDHEPQQNEFDFYHVEQPESDCGSVISISSSISSNFSVLSLHSDEHDDAHHSDDDQTSQQLSPKPQQMPRHKHEELPHEEVPHEHVPKTRVPTIQTEKVFSPNNQESTQVEPPPNDKTHATPTVLPPLRVSIPNDSILTTTPFKNTITNQELASAADLEHGTLGKYRPKSGQAQYHDDIRTIYPWMSEYIPSPLSPYVLSPLRLLLCYLFSMHITLLILIMQHYV